MSYYRPDSGQSMNLGNYIPYTLFPCSKCSLCNLATKLLLILQILPILHILHIIIENRKSSLCVVSVRNL